MTLQIKAQPRDRTGKQVRSLRVQGLMPAVLYGNNQKPTNLTIDQADFRRVYQKAGKTTLIDLAILDQNLVKVLIHDLQLHPVSNQIIHTDFYQVKLTEKIHATVPVQVVGEAPAVKELQGTMIVNKNELDVEAYPQDLVPAIEVDISPLKTFDDVIHAKDLLAPKGIEILTDPDEVIVLIQPPRSEEELAKLEEKPVEDVETVAVEEKGQEEATVEDEGQEGTQEKVV